MKTGLQVAGKLHRFGLSPPRLAGILRCGGRLTIAPTGHRRATKLSWPQAGVNAGSVTGLARVMEVLEQASDVYAAYIGLDVHNETIAVAMAECGRGAPVLRGVGAD